MQNAPCEEYRPTSNSKSSLRHECPSYGQVGQGNQGRIRWIREGRVRWTRKAYGLDQIRYTWSGFAHLLVLVGG